MLVLLAAMTVAPLVVDGDTIILGREHIRIANIDAPEIGHPHCDAELRLGKVARQRLKALLGSGRIVIRRGDPGSRRTKDRYGRTRFGQSCLMARRLIEAGVRFVTVNMFETVFDEVTWDIHGSKPFTDIVQMSKEVAPNFDAAYTALAQRPWSAVRMVDVAAVAGVSRQTLYNEFGSKEGLARALVRREADAYLAGVERALAAHSDARERLTATAEWTASTARENALVRAMLTGCWSERLPSPTLSAVPSSSAVPAPAVKARCVVSRPKASRSSRSAMSPRSRTTAASSPSAAACKRKPTRAAAPRPG